MNSAMTESKKHPMLLLVPEQERWRQWWPQDQIEILSFNQVLRGFRLYIVEHWLLEHLDACWSVVEETLNEQDQILVSAVSLAHLNKAQLFKLTATSFPDWPSSLDTYDASIEGGGRFYAKSTPIGQIIVHTKPSSLCTPFNPMKSSLFPTFSPDLTSYTPRLLLLENGDFNSHYPQLQLQALLWRFRIFPPQPGVANCALPHATLNPLTLKTMEDSFRVTFSLQIQSLPTEITLLHLIQLLLTKIQLSLSILGQYDIDHCHGHWDQKTTLGLLAFKIQYHTNLLNGQDVPLVYRNTELYKRPILYLDGTLDATTCQRMEEQLILWHHKLNLINQFEDRLHLVKTGFIDIETGRVINNHIWPIQDKHSLQTIESQPIEIQTNEDNPLQLMEPSQTQKKPTNRSLLSISDTLRLPHHANGIRITKSKIASSQSFIHRSVSQESKRLAFFSPKLKQIAKSSLPNSAHSSSTNQESSSWFILSQQDPSFRFPKPLDLLPLEKKSSITSICCPLLLPELESLEQFPNWLQFIDQIAPITLVGYRIYVNLSLINEVSQPFTIVEFTQDPQDKITLTLIKPKPNEPGQDSDSFYQSIWNFYVTKLQDPLLITFLDAKLVVNPHGPQSTSSSQTHLIHIADGQVGKSLFQLHLQYDLFCLGIIETSSPFNHINHIHIQEICYTKYNLMNCRLPQDPLSSSSSLDQSVQHIIRLIQTSLFVLNYLSLNDFSPHYHSKTAEAVKGFQQYLVAQGWSLSGEINGWMTPLLLNEMIKQVCAVELILQQLGYQVPDPYEQIEAFEQVFNPFQKTIPLGIHSLQTLNQQVQSEVVDPNYPKKGSLLEQRIRYVKKKKTGHRSRPSISIHFGDHSQMATSLEEHPLLSTTNLIQSDPSLPLQYQDSSTSTSIPIPSLDIPNKQVDDLVFEHEKMLSRYADLSSNYLTLRDFLLEVQLSISSLANRLDSSMSAYAELFQQFTHINHLLKRDSQAMETLMQNVVHLEMKLQQLERQSRKSFFKISILYLTMFIFFIILLPLWIISIIMDLYQRVSVASSSNSHKEESYSSRLFQYYRSKMTGLDIWIDKFETKAAILIGQKVNWIQSSS